MKFFCFWPPWDFPGECGPPYLVIRERTPNRINWVNFSNICRVVSEKNCTKKPLTGFSPLKIFPRSFGQEKVGQNMSIVNADDVQKFHKNPPANY